MCKYTPEAIFKVFGLSAKKLEPSVVSFDYSDSMTHANLCSYSKAVLQASQNDNVLVLYLLIVVIP